jgi:predicted metal-dependent enzyme (double-stranded beta helix superfamily)
MRPSCLVAGHCWDRVLWGVIAILKGILENQEFHVTPWGMMLTSRQLIRQGDVVSMSPRVRDIHRMGNPTRSKTAISIHVYGAPLTEVCRNRYAEGPNRLPPPITPMAAWAGS